MLADAIIYTDGSSGNGGDGGWAAIVATPYYGVELWGWAYDTTNNRMEMQAAISGLQYLTEPHRVKLVSDSAYLLNSLQHKWYEKWFEDVVKTGYTRPNLDLWHIIAKLNKFHTIEGYKIKGHSGHEHNERVDKLAVTARKEKLIGWETLYGNTV